MFCTHVLAGERIHGDDTTMPVLDKTKTVGGRLWTYVRDDRPFGGPAPLAAVFYYSRDPQGEHPQRHLAAIPRLADVLEDRLPSGIGQRTLCSA